MIDSSGRSHDERTLSHHAVDGGTGATQAALYDSFDPAEARRILRRIEFHYTPKHASWLNMVEIEIGVLVGQCLDRRIPDKLTLVTEIAHWERLRNASGDRIKWMFTVDRARIKLARSYPVREAV